MPTIKRAVQLPARTRFRGRLPSCDGARALFRPCHSYCPEQNATASLETSEFCGLKQPQSPKLRSQLLRQFVGWLTLHYVGRRPLVFKIAPTLERPMESGLYASQLAP